MPRDVLVIQDVKLPLYSCNTLVIGSGAASLNCASHLHSFGVRDVFTWLSQLDLIRKYYWKKWIMWPAKSLIQAGLRCTKNSISFFFRV